MKPTIKNIEAAFAKTLAKELGVAVEVTARARGEWTVSGPDADARKAAAWLVSKNLLRVTEAVHDDDLAETFVYLTDAQ
jgi:arginine decarboxylase-like protein